jgi:hypothetical protein
VQISDDLFLGPAIAPALPDSNPSPMAQGVGPVGRVYSYDVVPLAPQTASIAALQTTAGAASLTLAAGTGVTAATDANGNIRYAFDVPRAVSLTSAANISAVNFTITGYDVYGQRMTQTLAGPNANTVSTTKAFKSVISVAVNGAVGTNTSVGASSILGLPVAVADAGYVVQAGWAGVLAKDGGTFTAADATSPATASTGDVRGTFLPSSAPNGTRRLVFTVALSTAQVGPLATRIAAFGVTQV